MTSGLLERLRSQGRFLTIDDPPGNARAIAENSARQVLIPMAILAVVIRALLVIDAVVGQRAASDQLLIVESTFLALQLIILVWWLRALPLKPMRAGALYAMLLYSAGVFAAYFDQTPEATTTHLIMIVGVFFYVLDRRWMIIAQTFGAATWLILVFTSDDPTAWQMTGLTLFVGVIAGLAFRVGRIASIRDTAALHYDGELRQSELERSLEERKRLEQQLVEQEKFISINRVAGGFAHDFNNLFQVIRGYTELSEAYAESDELKKYLARITQASNDGAEKCAAVLTYAGAHKTSTEYVDVNQCVRDVLANLELPEIGLDLSAQNPRIDADPAGVAQVVLNLVVNAVESADVAKVKVSTSPTSRFDAVAGTTIEQPLKSEQARNGVLLEVQDTGPGFPHADVFNVFDLYYSTKFLGRGNGLAAVRGIVRAHGAGLKVATSDSGTNIAVWFPAEVKQEF